MAQALPVVATWLAAVGQVGLLAVAHIKQIAQHGHRVALLAVAQQRCHRHAQKLAEQVKQGAFNRRDGMDGHAQIKSLVAATAAVPPGKCGAQAVENVVPVAQHLAFNQGAGVFQGVADFFATRHFTDAGAARTVGQDQQVAREKRAVRTAQVEQHAVMAGDWDDLHTGDVGRGGRRDLEICHGGVCGKGRASCLTT